MIYTDSIPIKDSYKNRLIYLILQDMQKSDITLLLVNGFKGLENMTLDELEHSVIDRYEIEENQLARLTYEVIK